jgi:hypothetical protein
VTALDHSIAYQEVVVSEFTEKYSLTEKKVIDGIIMRRYGLPLR